MQICRSHPPPSTPLNLCKFRKIFHLSAICYFIFLFPSYLWQLISVDVGVASRPQINSTTLKQESIEIISRQTAAMELPSAAT